MSTIVIVGGGTAGIAAARALRGRLPVKHRVVVVERAPEVCFQPGFLHVMLGRRHRPEITRSTDRMRAAGAEVLRAEVTAVDTGRRTVRLSDGRILHYDQLILAAGAEAETADTPELAAAGHNLYTCDGALAIRRVLQDFCRGEVVIAATARPYRYPPALFEAASLLHEWFARHGRRRAVNISLHIPEPILLPEAGTRVGDLFRKKLAAAGIALHTGRRFVNADPGRRVVRFEDGEIPYDLLVYVPRHRAPTFAAESGLLDEHGWVPADPFTLETEYEDVYAVGDINRIPLPSGCDLPKAGLYAHAQAFVVARNIERKLAGRAPDRFFGGNTVCLAETGSAAVPFFGDLYRKNPRAVVLPESRLWLAGKWLVEKLWLREHS